MSTFVQAEVAFSDGKHAVVWLPTKGLREGHVAPDSDPPCTPRVIYHGVVLRACRCGRKLAPAVVRCHCGESA